ncbi:hypothetical protein ABBQ32_010248 [Trebouxia sp. C0010 RCD-2024]
MAGKEAHNEVHITENWRQTVKREQTQAKHFKDIWGFLVSPEPPTSLTRPHAVKTVKYVNPHGGTWTVAAQRIPVQSKDDMEAEAASTLSDSGHLSALAATNITHAERVDWSHCHNPSFRTTNQKYGQRLPLEQFGVPRRTNAPSFVTPFDLMEQEAEQ